MLVEHHSYKTKQNQNTPLTMTLFSHIITSNQLITDLLINPDHMPRTRSV